MIKALALGLVYWAGNDGVSSRIASSHCNLLSDIKRAVCEEFPANGVGCPENIKVLSLNTDVQSSDTTVRLHVSGRDMLSVRVNSALLYARTNITDIERTNIAQFPSIPCRLDANAYGGRLPRVLDPREDRELVRPLIGRAIDEADSHLIDSKIGPSLRSPDTTRVFSHGLSGLKGCPDEVDGADSED